MTLHLPRFSERSTYRDIPNGTYGKFDLDGHEIPLFVGDNQVGIMFVDGTAHCTYDDGFAVYRIDCIGGASLRSGEVFESVQRYVANTQHMVEHDYE